MNATIRQAGPTDAAAIARVQVESWRTTYKDIVPDAYLAALDPEASAASYLTPLANSDILTLLVEDAAGIFGFIAGGAIREALDTYDAELYMIYLLAGRQQQGTGRKLIQRLASELQTRGFQSMAVWALEQNSAVSFYKRLGAIPVTRKIVEIGGASLPDLALGWPNWTSLL